MRTELSQLKSELLKLNINPDLIGVDELPLIEGFCIYDVRSHLEVFYSERGSKVDCQEFSDILKAIEFFKDKVLSEPSFRLR
ncbi:hypothetical protein RI845_15965 [Thalassotalea nanhaiensis]|uniref:Uncharacterized protein n=1 Tax=Thalassotalea nanhaiensis TaxID=3065648 RepID=A0ABY9TGZ1_9GAMM|nr:hypothetical protein RI845_15965 [Colwelliaceae bacterium SQ345]